MKLWLRDIKGPHLDFFGGPTAFHTALHIYIGCKIYIDGKQDCRVAARFSDTRRLFTVNPIVFVNFLQCIIWTGAKAAYVPCISSHLQLTASVFYSASCCWAITALDRATQVFIIASTKAQHELGFYMALGAAVTAWGWYGSWTVNGLFPKFRSSSCRVWHTAKRNREHENTAAKLYYCGVHCNCYLYRLSLQHDEKDRQVATIHFVISFHYRLRFLFSTIFWEVTHVVVFLNQACTTYFPRKLFLRAAWAFSIVEIAANTLSRISKCRCRISSILQRNLHIEMK